MKKGQSTVVCPALNVQMGHQAACQGGSLAVESLATLVWNRHILGAVAQAWNVNQMKNYE